jgi:hypothetical protein
MPLILESIVTTRNPDGSVNIAPMGPIVDEGVTRLLLRPFKTSTTFQNLVRTRCGICHVTDDVLLLAQAAINRIVPEPRLLPAEAVVGDVLADACRWYEFRVTAIDDSSERTEMQAEVVHTGRLRDFFGFNRAKHAVVEGAILATRVHLLPRESLLEQFAALRVTVEKTAGPSEMQAFALLDEHVRGELAAREGGRDDPACRA